MRCVECNVSKCDACFVVIDWDEDGGHIYPDNSVLCADCDGKTLEEILAQGVEDGEHR